MGNIALNVCDMKLAGDDLEKIESIYNNDNNSFVDNDGRTKVTHSFAKFSKTADVIYTGDPMYVTYKYGIDFLSENCTFKNEAEGQFADSIMNDLLDEKNATEAVEGAVIMNLWMEI